jgi:hypothetical protein
LDICGFWDCPPVYSDVVRISTKMRLGQHKLVTLTAIAKPGDLLCITQVQTNWDWKDVHKADLYLEEIEKLWNGNATSERYAQLHN